MSVATNESIYRLIPPLLPQITRPPKHKSHFSESVREEAKHRKSNNKTMGPAKVTTNCPANYLKKHSKEIKLPDSTQSFKTGKTYNPSVPKHTDQPVMAGVTTKNFITTNAIANITAVPKNPTPKYVDDPFGARHTLENSGLVPKYQYKKEYGQVPHYLSQRREEMIEAQTEYDRQIDEFLEQGQMQQLSLDDKATIMEGLKKNWEKLHHDYQGLSVITDTPAKKARKERMEAEMKQLEKDIELLERHSVIYIGNSAQ